MGLSDTEILMPASADDAVDAFGDGRDVTVFAGGTILMPMLAYGRYPQAGPLGRMDQQRGQVMRIEALGSKRRRQLGAAARIA